MTKDFQNGIEIDATTHQQTMQQLVPKKVRTAMDNHGFLKCRNMQIHFTGYHILRLCKEVAERNVHQQIIENDTNRHPQIDDNQCKIHARKCDAKIQKDKTWSRGEN